MMGLMICLSTSGRRLETDAAHLSSCTIFKAAARGGKHKRLLSCTVTSPQLGFEMFSDAIANERVALRDQFVEGVCDPSLQRELHKFLRDHPRCIMIEVQDEAQLWFVEEPPVSLRTTKYRCSSNMTQCLIFKVQEKKSVTLEDILQVVAEQGKAIGELTQDIKNLAVRGGSTRVETSRPRSQPKFPEDGQPICFKCQIAGHSPEKQSSRFVRSASSGTQGNKNPWLL